MVSKVLQRLHGFRDSVPLCQRHPVDDGVARQAVSGTANQYLPLLVEAGLHSLPLRLVPGADRSQKEFESLDGAKRPLGL